MKVPVRLRNSEQSDVARLEGGRAVQRERVQPLPEFILVGRSLGSSPFTLMGRVILPPSLCL